MRTCWFMCMISCMRWWWCLIAYKTCQRYAIRADLLFLDFVDLEKAPTWKLAWSVYLSNRSGHFWHWRISISDAVFTYSVNSTLHHIFLQMALKKSLTLSHTEAKINFLSRNYQEFDVWKMWILCKWYFRNVNFVKNDISEVRILWIMWFQKC